MAKSPTLPLVQVRPHNGAPALFIEGEPMFALLLMSGPQAIEDMKLLGGCSIRLVSDSFDLGWVGVDKYDFAALDDHMHRMVRAVPDALILLRVMVDAPTDWMDAHPDELVGYAHPEPEKDGGSWGGVRHASFASRLWRNAAGEALRRHVEHVKASEYANHVLGWHVGSGIYGEWHYWNAVAFPDTSPTFVVAYDRWLQWRYPHNPPPPRVPTLEDRRHGDVGMFRDPAKSKWITDYFEFFHEVGADALAEFAAIVKQVTDRRSLVIAFNGYLPDLNVNQEIDTRRFDKILRCGDVDGFASPHSYWRRKPGDDAIMRGFPASVRVMGKLWFDEADDRTSIAHPSQYKHVASIAQTVEVLWRSFAHALTHSCGIWFMDQGGLWYMKREKGWYQDKAILGTLNRMKEIAADSMNRPRTRVSQVAVVVDLRSALHLADRSSGLDQVTHTLISHTVAEFTRCGAPFDLLLMSELTEPAVPDYDVYVFLDAFFMTEDQLKQVTALKEAGKPLLFFYAAGLLSDQGLSVNRMSRFWA